MKMLTGRVVDGKVEVENEVLVEGSVVTVLVDDPDEEWVEVTPEEEEMLLAAIAEAERGETIPAEQVLAELRRRD